MKKNKILSLLIAFVMIFTLVPATLGFAETEELSTQQIAINTVMGLGIMTPDAEGNFLADVQVSRGELATIISNMFNTGDNALVEWKEKFFKELDEEFETADSFQSTEELFTDVDNTSEYYSAIKTVSELGIMTGYTDGSFGPEGQLTYEQAIKVIVYMLGYKSRADIYGGFPTGYMRMASDLKLLNGLTQTTGLITNGDMATLIYNALDVRMLEITSVGDNIEYTAENTKTYLERFLGMRRLTGRITDNGYSNFIGDQVATKDFMTIGGVAVRVAADKSYARGYLGRTVNAYVAEENGTYNLVYAALDGLDTVVTIDVNDFKLYESGKITYKVGESTKTVAFDPYADMIYNGTGTPSYNADTFDFSAGTITVVTPKGSNKADMLIVEAYESYYVDYVDYINKVIYSKKAEGDSYVSVEVDLDRDENYYLIVKNPDGTPMDVSEITSDSVVSVAEGINSMTAVISNTKIQNFIINEMNTVDGTTYISNGKETYPLSKKFVEEKGTESIEVGETYTLYTDIFGEAVYFKLPTTAKDKYTTAILINSMKTTGLEPITAIKVIKDDGVVEDYDIAKKITVSGDPDISISSNDEKVKTPDEFYNIVKEYHGLLRYSLNAEDQVNYVEFPIKQVTLGNPDNRLTEIYLPDTEGLTSSTNPHRDLFFSGSGLAVWQHMPNQGFAGRILVNRTEAKVFVCPRKPDDSASDADKSVYKQQLIDEEYYSIATAGESFGESKYMVKAYTTVADSKYAQYLINYKSNSSTTSIAYNTRTFYVFNRSYQGVDEDGNPCAYISYYQGTTEKKLALSQDCMNGNEIKVESIMNAGVALDGFKLEKGDIFRMATNAEGKVSIIQIIVDENASNPASGFENNVGNLYNTDGKWDSVNYASGKTNPYVVYNETGSTENIFTDKGNWWSDGYMGYMRNGLFWPVYTRGTNEICLTTQPLGVEGEKYELDELGEEFVTDSYIMASVNAITITANGVTVKSIPISQLKTYEFAGNNCDRIFLSTRVGSPQYSYAYINYSEDLGN